MAAKGTKKKAAVKKKGEDIRVIINEDSYNDPIYIVKNAPSPKDALMAAFSRYLDDHIHPDEEDITIKWRSEDDGEEIVLTNFS